MHLRLYMLVAADWLTDPETPDRELLHRTRRLLRALVVAIDNALERAAA